MKKDISLRIKKSGEGYLSPACRLTIDKADEFRSALLKALERADRLVVNLKKLVSADLTCIQLFCSANNTFQKENKKIIIKDLKSSEVLTKALLEHGFNGTRCISDNICKSCLWEEVI